MAKKLLDQTQDILRLKHYSYRAEEAYLDWVRRFILFHDKHHPAEMGSLGIQAFLVHLATERNVSASTQNQALSALQRAVKEAAKKANIVKRVTCHTFRHSLATHLLQKGWAARSLPISAPCRSCSVTRMCAQP
jgi:site-specific recombinase XerD